MSNFTVAATPRVFDKQANDWKDGDTLFLRCAIWRQAAENVAESLRKGDRVIVSGRLKQRSFEDREGVNRTVIECDVDEIGASLKFRMIPHGAGRAERRSEPDPNDKWGSGSSSGGDSGGGSTDEPPF